jgi:hypothetical protein
MASLTRRCRIRVVLLLTGAVLLIVGCTHRSDPSAKPVAATKISAFVGNASCAECHAMESKNHQGSRHDRTMQTASAAGLGKLAPAVGVVPLAGYALEERSGGFAVVRQAFDSDRPEVQPLQLALGSGKVGMTFLALLSPDTLLETRMSYFPDYRLWDLTPGQEVKRAGDVPFGRTHTGEEARRCVGCHSTTVPELTLQLEPNFYGVGCEACHGPARAHLEAMRAQNFSEPHMEKLGKLSSTKLNELCGRCHRNTADVNVQTAEVKLTHRFQPYALQRSMCRTKSNEPLSCLSCHDPHTDVSTDHKKYETTCLSCHAAPGTAHSASADPYARPSKVCPVNATTNCISCHMRPKRLFPETTIMANLADHLISIEHK